MTLDLTFLAALCCIAFASYACRVGGFVMMRYVRITPRIDAALRSVPVAVMVGIVTPAASKGSPPEIIALAVVGIAMTLTRSDLIAAAAGAATVAICRLILS
jgi:uncharacterized membrane protein